MAELPEDVKARIRAEEEARFQAELEERYRQEVRAELNRGAAPKGVGAGPLPSVMVEPPRTGERAERVRVMPPVKVVRAPPAPRPARAAPPSEPAKPARVAGRAPLAAWSAGLITLGVVAIAIGLVLGRAPTATPTAREPERPALVAPGTGTPYELSDGSGLAPEPEDRIGARWEKGDDGVVRSVPTRAPATLAEARAELARPDGEPRWPIPPNPPLAELQRMHEQPPEPPTFGPHAPHDGGIEVPHVPEPFEIE